MMARRRITVSIDLGSTFCGYAYSVDDGPIKLNEPWIPDSGIQHSKTPTALLYDENGIVLEHFGFSATTNIKRSRNFHFRFFKKSTEETKELNLTSMFANKCGVERNTLALYAEVLRKLKDHCLERLEEAELGERPDIHDVFWIIPVPVIWAVTEREFMIAAAVQAGLISEMKSTNLLIILEGDATYEFCKALDPHHDLVLRLSDQKVKRLEECDGVLVLDAGGKTVDATTKWNQGQNSDFVPNEMLHPAGFSAGGESINRAFEERLADILGHKYMRHLVEDELPLWMMFMGEFEVKKKNFSKDNKSILLSDSCVSNLANSYSKWSESQKECKSLADVFETNASGIHLDGYGRLLLSNQFVTELFKETISSITDFIDGQLQQTDDGKKIEAIYLAGGFASSPYLQQQVREIVGNRAVVVIPKHPEQGVLQGAIHYSRSHQCVATYKVDSNYGVITKELQNEEDSSLHPHLIERHATILKGNTYSRVYLRNELVEENCLIIYRDGQEFMRFPLKTIPNIIQHRRPSVKVYLQIVHTKKSKNVMKATVIDEITQECYIKRKEIYSKILMDVYKMAWIKKIGLMVAIVLISIALLSHPVGMAVALVALAYFCYDKITRN